MTMATPPAAAAPALGPTRDPAGAGNPDSITSDPEWRYQAGTYSYAARLQAWDWQRAEVWGFARDGIQTLAGLLRAEVEAERLRLQACTLREVEGTAADGGPLICHARVEDLLASPVMARWALAGDVMRVVEMWLGAPPVIADVCCWLSRADGGGATGAAAALPPVYAWHRDMDDLRQVKLFVYLSDVGDEQGPHEMIPGSHRPAWFEERGLPHEEYFWGSGRGTPMDALIGESVTRVTGPAGSRWVENTYCLHRATPVVSGERWVFQVCYALRTYGAGKRREAQVREAWGLA